MKLEYAQKLSEEFVKEIEPFCKSVMVCGSTRRCKPEPRDIDLVIIPSNMLLLKPKLKRLGTVELDGTKLIRVKYKGEQVDIYFCNEKTWGTNVLIRTGSVGHNIFLCSTAKKRGWKLKSADGLYNEKGERIAGDTEESIFEALGIEYKQPEERD